MFGCLVISLGIAGNGRLGGGGIVVGEVGGVDAGLRFWIVLQKNF